MKIRNKKENADYVGYLKGALDQIEQAIDSVTYVSYPELNQGVVAKLKEASRLLTACASAGLLKP